MPMTMVQRALKKVNNCWNTKYTFYFVTSGGQNFKLFLIAVRIINSI
jgi:hypothetical protein